MKAYSKRIEEIKTYTDKRQQRVVVITVDGWLSDAESGCFAEYVEKILKRTPEKSLILFDDTQLASNNLYLPCEPLHFLDKASAKPFLECFADAKWLEMYIRVIDKEKNHFAEIVNPAFQDFLKCYKSMSIEELVKRYSDDKWFTGKVN